MRLFIITTVLVLMSSLAWAQTQKIAYVESERIVPEMPAYKKAQSELKAYTKQLQKVLQQKQTALEKDYVAVMDSIKQGIMNELQKQRAQIRLQNGQQQLQQEASNADKKVAQKEGDLIEPLYKRFNEALEAVAKAEGYTYILDKQFMLYFVGGIDATDKVKTKLGI
ncbi:MAG: OmpH family outer membrane protein [Aureispira sp.]